MNLTSKELSYLKNRDRFEFLVRSEHTPTGIESTSVPELIGRGKIDLLKEKFKNCDSRSVITNNYENYETLTSGNSIRPIKKS